MDVNQNDFPTNLDEVAANQMASFRRAYDAKHQKWMADADRCESFFAGEQWDEADLKELADTKRPALTLNLIRPTVSAILGQYINKRASFNIKPRSDGDDQIADVLNKVLLQVCDQNNFEHVERMVFTDGVVSDRGYFDVRMDYDEDPQGIICIESIDPQEVVVDPQAKEYDPDSWREVYITKWMSKDDISVLYGDEKAEEARQNALTSAFGVNFVEYSRRNTFGVPDYGFQYGAVPAGDRDVRRIRVIERQYFRMDTYKVAVNTATGEETPVPADATPEDIAAFEELTGNRVITKEERKVRWTITAAGVVLFDDWSPYKHFTVVPYFPQFRRGKPLGVVRDLLDAQEQVNKLSSQALHVVNTTANSGWIMDEGAVTNMTPEELAANGSKTGLVVVKVPNKELTKIQPNQIPTGLMNLAASSQDFLKRISGVSDYMVGEGNSEVSGIALESRVNQNLTQLQPIFDSLDYSRTLLGKRIIRLIQTFYTDTRILRITTDETNAAPNQQQQIAINQPDPVTGRIINDLTVGTYDVVVSSQPSRDTFEDTQFAQAIQLVQAGVPIPPDILVELSTFSRKQEVAERIRQQLGMGQPTPEQQQQAQMQQQMQLQQFQLEMGKLQAQIQELQSQAQLNLAKAQSAPLDAAINYKGTVAKAQAQLATDQGKNETKLAIARLQAEANKLRASQAHTGRYDQQQSNMAGTY
jgi:hypothetical protein